MKGKEYIFGMIGLGTMGRNMLLNMVDHGYSVAGYDRDHSQVDILNNIKDDNAIKGYLSSRLAFITTVANKKKSDLESTLLLLSKENDEKKLLSAELYELKALRDTDVQIVRSRHMEDITKLRLDQLTALENEKAKCDIQVR